MTNTTYRAGIIGLGFIGGGDQVSGDLIGQSVAGLDGHHREALSKHPRLTLSAGCDLDEGRRQRFNECTGAAVYSDWRRMLEGERLDLVSIATSSPMHAELTLGCVEAGVRAIYCEKAIATSPAEADRMLAACENAGVLLAINHNRRFNMNYRRARDLVAAGGLGELRSVSLRWGAGRLGCTGTHLFDALQMLTGRNVAAVSGALDESETIDCRGPAFYDPGGWGVLRLEGGLHAVVNAPNHAVGPAELRIEGDRGALVTAGPAVTIETFEKPGQPATVETWPPSTARTSMDVAVSEIVEWLDEPGSFSTPPEDAARALEVIVGFHASHENNARWTNLPLKGEDRERRVLIG